MQNLSGAGRTGSGSLSPSYTPEGWLTARAFSFTSGPAYTLAYAYDALGQLAEVQYPDDNEALYDYTRGAVADVRLKVGASSVYAATGVSWRPMDLALSGWTSHNGLANAITYDSDLRPTSISVPNVENLSFSYDAANRITAITNSLHGSASQALGYDVLGRLTSVSGAEAASYVYDADGNRIHQMLNGTATSFSVAASSNRLLGSSGGSTASYGYDATGDITTVNGLVAYQYGPFGRLVNASGAGFVTSAAGQRLRKAFGGNTTYFAPDAGGTLLAEDDSGAWHDNVWLGGRLVAVIANAGVYAVHDDQTGRPSAVTNTTSTAMVWQANGLPFDRQVTANTWGEFNIGFSGQYWDTEDNLWHNGARDYDSTTGRYIESDPIGLAGGVNTFAYVGGNPVSNVDPLGLCDPCKDAGDAPSPQQYLNEGQALGNQPASLLNALGEISILMQFHRGGTLDAQAYGAHNDYANYVYGAFFAGLGWPLQETLGAANVYGTLFSAYNPNNVQMSQNYHGIPAANVQNIMDGYNAAKAGVLCSKSQ